MKSEEMTLDTEQHVDVKAAIGDVYKGFSTGSAKATPGPTASRCRWFWNNGPADDGFATSATARDTYGATYRWLRLRCCWN